MNAGRKGSSAASGQVLVASAFLLLFLVAGGPAGAGAQVEPEGDLVPVSPLRGRLERVRVHGASLVGNLEGDTPDRPVSVYLPPGYDDAPARRYPVVYFLHGFTDSDLAWFGWREHFVNVPAAFERALDAGAARAMILVMPNAYTAYAGSMYSSSVTTGDWERYVAEELVTWVDAHYRTVATREGRGLAGHSMGGYGAIRIGMERPDVFSSLYVMSPCCMEPRMVAGGGGARELAAIARPEQVIEASFGVQATFASAAAWSPNPRKPPFYLDLPFEDGEARPDVLARWAANAPLATVHQHVPELRRYRAIALDAGAQDRGIAAATRELADVLTAYGIAHTLEIYDPGDHINRVDERVEQHVLPFFSRSLAAAVRPAR
jgi:S-formylglutathione hydrolase FrmB